MDGRYYIQLIGETLEMAIAGEAYTSMKNAMIDAHEQLPDGALFKVLDSEFNYMVIYDSSMFVQNQLVS